MPDPAIQLQTKTAEIDLPSQADGDTGFDLAATILIAQAVAVGFAVVALLAFGWPWRSPSPKRAAIGWALGIGGAFLIGCWMLGAWPKWPPTEDQGRLIFLLVPTVILVEVICAVAANRWVAWPLRVAMSAAIAPTLLYGSIYLTDAAGPGSRVWTSLETAGILSAFAAAIAVQWLSLATLQQRTAGRSVPIALAVVLAATSVTIMLSGYASGGQLGLPLAAALGVCAIASLLISDTTASIAGLGVSLVCFAGLLIAGHFFGSLTTLHAALLFAAPLLCWLPEASSMRPWLRGGLRVVLVVVPLVVVVWLAQKAFVENSRPATSTPTGPEPSLNDYLNFGK